MSRKEPKTSEASGSRAPRPTDDASHQLQVVQRIADGLALEMNNVLAAIIGRASVLETELEPDGPARADVDAILAAGRSALDLTRDLLHFSRQYQFARDELSLNAIVGKVAALWKQTRPGSVRVECRLDDNVLPVIGDEARIRHMLQQLAVNACDAMPGAGVLTFTTKNVKIQDGSAPDPTFGGLPAGHYVRVQVSDSGTGMDPLTLRQALEPMFTTKAGAGATGLGLTQVLDTVTRHYGDVQLFSKRGLGTTATVYLPASSQTPSRAPHLMLEDKEGDRGQVLVVDDDPHVLRAGKRLLSKLGYQVRCTSNPIEALQHYSEHQLEISLVILDLVMPGMDGHNLLVRLQKMNPQVRVLIASGFDDDAARRHVLQMGASGFLSKPYTIDELRTAMAHALR